MKKQWAALAGLLVLAVVIVAAVWSLMRTPQRPRQVTVAPAAMKSKRLLDTATPRPAGAVDINIAFADATSPPPRTRFYLKKPIRPVEGPPAPGELAQLAPGLSRVDLSDFPDGDHHLYVVADGHAAQWRRVRVQDKQIVDGTAHDVTLHPAKYVTIRWAFNNDGTPELGDSDVVHGRSAVTHFGRVRYFGMDWQVWQAAAAKDKPSFGDVPMLSFHRISRNMGFLAAPDGVTFDEMTIAPPAEEYMPKSIEATPGLLLYCRVEGNTPKPGDRGFGKILIESVSTTRPTGIQICEPDFP